MTDAEFDDAATAIAHAVDDESLTMRIAAASRGSANPAGLAWLAESLSVDFGSRVVDLGAGLGGPAAWLSHRYGCEVVALEPAAGAVQGAVRLFDFPGARLSMVLGSALAVPFAAHRFDAALLLGVLSVVDPPTTALDEARRVGRRLGVWDYCSTTGSPVHAGGSRFPTPSELARWLAATGWQVVGTLDQLGEPPAEWRAGADVSPDDVPDEAVESEAEVVAAIESGRLEPRVLVARRVEDR